MFKKFALHLMVAFIAFSVSAQETSKDDEAAIARAKNTSLNQLEPGMQKVTLEYYLRSQSPTGSKFAWEVNDCGEQTGDPANRSLDPPTCVEADITSPHGDIATIFIAIGTVKTGTKAKPKVFSISFKPAKSEAKGLRRISQIPLEFGAAAGS